SATHSSVVSMAVRRLSSRSCAESTAACSCVGMGVQVTAQAPFPLEVKRPRSVFLNRLSLPLAAISRMMAAYKVASGVAPFVAQSLRLWISAKTCFMFMGSLALARTIAAASRPLTFLGLGSLAGFAALGAFGSFAALALPLPPLALGGTGV